MPEALVALRVKEVLVAWWLALLVSALGLDDEGQGREIVMSHPAVVSEMERVSRLVRLPYIWLSGLHY